MADYTLSNNTYFSTPKDNPKDLISVEIGDKKEPDIVLPQQKIMRWDNECNVSIRLKDFNEYSVYQDKEKVIFGNEQQEVHIYPITEGEGGQEFEIILLKQPKSNVIEFTLVDKDVEYFYQPALTAEEIAQGAQRPENVVGSYAVYAKTPKTNWTGGKEYKCGKVGHIYRPKIEDANGDWVWGELHIENKILSVTISQDFLDKAVYPVRHAAGLTFGYTTLGTTGGAFIAEWSDNRYSYRVSSQATSPASSGTLDSISFGTDCFSGTEAIDITGFVNQKDSGGANSHGQIASAESLNISHTTTPSFKTINFASEAVTAGTNYIVNILGNASDISTQYGATVRVRYDSVAGSYYNESFSGAGGYAAGKENPWTKAPSAFNRNHSIYCTYTAGGETTTSTSSSTSTTSTSSSSSTTTTSSSSSISTTTSSTSSITTTSSSSSTSTTTSSSTTSTSSSSSTSSTTTSSSSSTTSTSSSSSTTSTSSSSSTTSTSTSSSTTTTSSSSSTTTTSSSSSSSTTTTSSSSTTSTSSSTTSTSSSSSTTSTSSSSSTTSTSSSSSTTSTSSSSSTSSTSSSSSTTTTSSSSSTSTTSSSSSTTTTSSSSSSSTSTTSSSTTSTSSSSSTTSTSSSSSTSSTSSSTTSTSSSSSTSTTSSSTTTTSSTTSTSSISTSSTSSSSSISTSSTSSSSSTTTTSSSSSSTSSTTTSSSSSSSSSSSTIMYDGNLDLGDTNKRFDISDDRLDINTNDDQKTEGGQVSYI